MLQFAIDLANGVLLCKVLNVLHKGAVPRINEGRDLKQYVSFASPDLQELSGSWFTQRGHCESKQYYIGKQCHNIFATHLFSFVSSLKSTRRQKATTTH